jgi:hypothetical protein
MAYNPEQLAHMIGSDLHIALPTSPITIRPEDIFAPIRHTIQLVESHQPRGTRMLPFSCNQSCIFHPPSTTITYGLDDHAQAAGVARAAPGGPVFLLMFIEKV